MAAALVARTHVRPPSKRIRPRLVYGPVPITSIKYMSLAMRSAGYETLTLVDERYVIHAPDDFDGDTDTWLNRWPVWRALSWLLGEYAVFGWLVGRYDIFHYFFDGGFLRRTPLRFAELQLLHLAGKKAIVLPYGSDVAIPSRIRSLDWRHGLMRNYPQSGRHEAQLVRAVDYFSRRADYIVACLVHLETLPRWDLLTIHYYPIDTDAWAPAHGDSGHDGTDGPVTILHAPNHRAMKGTDALMRACDELRSDGLEIELRLLERVPNSEVRAAMDRADLIAEEFLLGYGLTAMEGMSLSKPVLSNLAVEGYYEVFRRQTRFDDCPIVSTTPETLSQQLRRLVRDPALRRRLGQEGREFTLREHSYGAMATLWEAVYARVWHAEPVEPADLITPVSKPPTPAADVEAATRAPV
jgi:glycosyltransferase involved in cell wall biosynthesis